MWAQHRRLGRRSAANGRIDGAGGWASHADGANHHIDDWIFAAQVVARELVAVLAHLREECYFL
jgi:hypothetical protein